MRKLTRTLVAMMAMLIIGGASTRTEAAMILSLTDGTTTVNILDNGAGDTSPEVGAVSFSGAIGVFNFNATTGVSKPLLPNTSGLGWMDLVSVNLSSTGPGTLQIGLIDTDFLATPSGTLTGKVGGTTSGTVAFAGFKCEQTNELPDCSAASILLGPFSGGAFSGTDSDSHGPLGPYSMALFATIVHGEGANISSFDFELKNVPEPASMALLGLGLLGFGAASRRRKLAR